MIIRIYRGLLLATIMVSIFSCEKNDMGIEGNNGKGFMLSVVAESMSPESVVTRVADSKSEKEREIHELHVFIFGPDKKYLAANQDDGGHPFQGYQVVNGSSSLYIDNDGFADLKMAQNATVYVVANVEPGTFGKLTESGYPLKIPNEDSLKQFVYKPENYRTLTSLPVSGMPMVGQSVGTVDLTQANGAEVIELKALMARIDFSFSVNDVNGGPGGLPVLNLLEYEVKNMPTAIPLIAPAGETNLDLNGDGEPDAVKNEFRSMNPEVDIIYNQTGTATLSFYVFENLRNPGYAEYPAEYTYPMGVLPDDYQRYKPLLAVNQNTQDTIPATHIVIKGYFTDVDDINYLANATIYLGKNPTNDFNVRRNHQYKNNVTIMGISNTGNTPGEVGFDARIDVETTNSYYISILKHKELDAHFNIVPLDVYLFDKTARPSLDIAIDNPSENKWFRIERVSAAVMESGEPGDDRFIAHPGEAWHSGTGKRKYFTTDLVTDPNQLGNSTECPDMGDQDRIYIYVDENISTETRQADLILTYKEGEEVKETKTITLVQHGLLPVVVDGETIYAEAYEEYLNYSDPLSQWNSPEQVFDGLYWGANGTPINTYSFMLNGWLGENAAIENYTQGYEGTIAILMATGIYEKEYIPFRGYMPSQNATKPMILDEKPETAAEYCYRKNKTDANGYISRDSVRWYLPAIRELERTVTTYYNQFQEFHNFFYWSSAAARRGENDWTEATGFARATKAYLENGVIKYYNSGYGADESFDVNLGHNSTGGRAPRTAVLRIRAVYKPTE